MQRTFADIIQAFKKVDAVKATVAAFDRTEEVLLNTVAEQLSQGITGRDQPIVSPYTGNIYYAQSTIEYKRQNGVGLGRVTDRITLYMTGRHYGGLYATLRGRSLEIGSSVEYDVPFNRANKDLYQPGTQFGQDYINDALAPAFFDEMMIQLNR